LDAEQNPERRLFARYRVWDDRDFFAVYRRLPGAVTQFPSISYDERQEEWAH
jgi:hypothetical protein